MSHCYIIIYPEFKKYIELLEKIPEKYFVHILLGSKNKYIDPDKTIMIMFSRDTKHEATYLFMDLIKDGFCSALYTNYNILNQDRYYLVVN